MHVIHRPISGKKYTKDEAPYGWVLLGRDTETWGEEGTGTITVDPDAECQNGCPHYHDDQYDPLNDLIHLNIAAFRDRLCPRTLFNLFNKAKNPSRIFVRLIQQRDFSSSRDDDADCWKRFCTDYPQLPCEKFKDNVQVLTMKAESAKGPTDPRSKLSAMVAYDYFHSEKPMLMAVDPRHYCMQTDSHMDFNQNFDIGLIEMFHRARNDYAVLSTYVADISQTDTNPTNVPHLCMVELSNTWRNWGTKFCEHLVRPKLTNVAWGAGLSFSKCHAELNVPYDPFLPSVFNGEELSRGIRFFTHGYDMYTPDQVLVTHDYHGHQSNPIVHSWGMNGKRLQDLSLLRGNGTPQDESSDMSIFMNDILAVSPTVTPKGVDRLNILMGLRHDQHSLEKIASSRYGLGDRRTLQDSIEFSGFDPVKKRMTKNTCGNLAWVPFVEDENFGLDKNLKRPHWTATAMTGDSTANALGDLPLEKNEFVKTEMKESLFASSKHQFMISEVAHRQEGKAILLFVAIGLMAVLLSRRSSCCELVFRKRRKAARLVL